MQAIRAGEKIHSVPPKMTSTLFDDSNGSRLHPESLLKVVQKRENVAVLAVEIAQGNRRESGALWQNPFHRSRNNSRTFL